MTPAERVAKAVEYGSQIHPRYREEFDNGIAVAWHRVPSAMGCFGLWSEETRARHYDNLCGFDGRIVLAGEHASYLPAFGAKHAIGFEGPPATLSEEQIAAVINYVRTHFGNRYKDSITAAEVAALDRSVH